MYSVEAEYVDRVMAEYGPCKYSILYLIHTSEYRSATKVGAIVAGQTSVKAPEKAAFEKHLPEDVYIISCHSLHGPTVTPQGQPLVCPPTTSFTYL